MTLQSDFIPSFFVPYECVRCGTCYKGSLIVEAEEFGHSARAGKLTDQRAALIRELAAATGFGGRDRRLGDETERARKTVGARLRDSLRRIERVHPQAAAHLQEGIRIGTSCSYQPVEPTTWRLGRSGAPDQTS